MTGKKKQRYRQELTLGLTLIILVLVILNIASHYALHRLKDSMLMSVRDDLIEAGLVLAARLIDDNATVIDDSSREKLLREYELSDWKVIHFNYERSLALSNDRMDPDLAAIEVDITPKELKPLLSQTDVFIHRFGTIESHYLHLLDIDGSSFVLHLTAENNILASLERAGRVLVFFGFVGIIVIVIVAVLFIRKATGPINKLREKAVLAGRYNAGNKDEITGLIGSYEKIISDLKAKENELIRLNRMITNRADELEAYNEYILGSIPTAIITLDSDGRLVSSNTAAASILGMKLENDANSHYSDVLGQYRLLSESIGRYFQTQQAVSNQELTINVSDGEFKTLVFSITSLTDGSGNVIGTSILINNITELVLLQKEIEAKNSMAMLGEMSGGLAHQLRNSMAAIVGLSKLINKNTEATGRVGENAALIFKEASEAEELVKRFLDFARPLDLSIGKCNVSTMMSEAIDLVNKKQHDINLYFNNEKAGDIYIPADELLLKQAVLNLIDNAVNAAGEGGIVKIEIHGKNQELYIDIEDNGPGIPDDVAQKIFAPFYSDNPSGTGLGLPLARKIVILHGGHLDFSNLPDGGVVFRIRLPYVRSDYPNREPCDNFKTDHNSVATPKSF